MNVQVDPCDDFYSYACGNFVKNTEYIKNQQSITTSKLMQERIDKRLEGLLEDPIRNDDISAFKVVKLLYSSCKTNRKQSKSYFSLKKKNY